MKFQKLYEGPYDPKKGPQHMPISDEEAAVLEREAPHLLYGQPDRTACHYTQEDGVTQTLNERGSKYGAFEDNARIAQCIKEAMQCNTAYEVLPNVMREALDLIALKLSRILTPNADHAHIDNWHDIAGYAQLVERALTKKALDSVSMDPP